MASARKDYTDIPDVQRRLVMKIAQVIIDHHPEAADELRPILRRLRTYDTDYKEGQRLRKLAGG